VYYLFAFPGTKIGEGNYSTVYNGFVNIKSKVEQVAWKVSNIRNADNSVLLKELKTMSMPKLAHKNICQMVMHVNINGKEIITID